jgi:hypothetical protein
MDILWINWQLHRPPRSHTLHVLHLFVVLVGLLCPPFRTTGSPGPELSGQDEAASRGQHQHGVLRSKGVAATEHQLLPRSAYGRYEPGAGPINSASKPGM